MQRKTLAGLGLALWMAGAAGLRAEESLAPQAPDQPPMGAPAQGAGGPPATAPAGGQDNGPMGAAPDDAQGPGGGMMGNGMGAPDPGQAFDELKDQLGLSADQADKLKAIGEDARTKNQGHMKAMMDLIKTLDGLVQAKAGDAALQAALDKIKAEHKAMQADRDAAMDQREAVLTPQQAAKFVLAMRDKMRQGMLRRMRQGGAGQDQQ
jgi:Spy/CpxP family protein refolding chaperone